MQQMKKQPTEKLPVWDLLADNQQPGDVKRLEFDGQLYEEDVAQAREAVPELQRFENLQELQLAGMQLEDPPRLAFMQRLESLDLSHNALTELEGRGLPPKLRYLDVAFNQLTELNYDLPLRHLRNLNAGHNNLKDIEGLEKAPMLEHVVLSANPSLHTLRPLKSCRYLQKLFALGVHPLSFDALENLKELEALYISPRSVEDLIPLTKLPKLRRLYIASPKLRSLEGWPVFPHLNELSIKRSPLLHDIRPLAVQQDLIRLDVSFNSLTNVSTALALPKLSYLDIRGNAVPNNEVISELQRKLQLIRG